MTTPDRREFLLQSLGLGALALSGCKRTTYYGVGRDPGPEPGAMRSQETKKKLLFPISLAQWSLHDALFKKQLDPLDFPLVAKRDHGIDAVEYVSTFYKEKKGDDAHFAELAKRCKDLGVESRLIMVDGEGRLGAATKEERDHAIANHARWLAIAHALGCIAIRVNAEGDGTPEEHRDRVAESMHALGEKGETLGLYVIIENHGGITSNGAWLASVMRAAKHPRVGTLPDFGNFKLGEGQQYDRYKGVEELMPFARAVSAKTYDFDSDGNETTIDYRRMMKLVLAAGYHAHVGIEYEGSRLSEKDGIRATKLLLERLRVELA
ncbi:MAG: sugar phosphate isomerase/epimerase [Planctomycetes bacterium]|nr:sugar phosphate isomerase/epimerase [Planctomycetota bacterium]